jgi:ubiquinone/menaquinone biosynthesis C-methylase UbiE
MHSPARHRTSSALATKGLSFGGGQRYDLHEWLSDIFRFRGQVRALKQRVVTLARLLPGEHVLDVGCGIGLLALQA